MIGSGCTTNTVEKVVYIVPKLPVPVRPSLPTWNVDDMQCLSDEMKQKISTRDKMRRQYAEELETIIKTANEGVKQ